MITDLNELLAEKGDRILPKWNELVTFLEESGVRFGHGIKVNYIPGQGIVVTAEPQNTPWIHPWKVGVPDDENRILLRAGTVNGSIPWVSEDAELGNVDQKTGEQALVQLEPQNDGDSYIAVGVNIGESESDFAELDDEAGYEQLRVAEIKELPNGFGSGGVVPEGGWAWYPLALVQWNENLVERVFQIVYHNLQHKVVGGGQDRTLERHFFFGAG